MPDLTTASDDVKNQQAALLQAIAEQGSRGKANYEQTQAQTQANRQVAVQSALANAQAQGGPGTSGAPAALQTQLGAQAAVPGNERAADISAAQANFGQDQAALTNANDSYMNQLGAAVPLVAAHAQAAAQQRAADRALQLQLQQLQVQQAQASLANTQSKTTQESVAAKKYADQQAQQANQQQVIDQAQRSGSTGRAFLQILQSNPDLPSALADLEAGAQPSTVRSRVGDLLGRPMPDLSEFHKLFGADADPDAVAQMLNAYYSHPSADVAAPAAPGTGVGAAIAGF